MKTVLRLTLENSQIERLDRAATALGRTLSEVAVLLLEESLRERDYPWIEFRDTATGRQAYIRDTRITVWMLVSIARSFQNDAGLVASHLTIPVSAVEGAFAYAAAFSAEIEEAIRDNDKTVEELRELLPDLIVLELSASSA